VTTAFAETPRLILGRLDRQDVDAFLAYRNDPEVARYQSWDRMTRAEATALVDRQAARAPGVAGEWFQFAVRLKADGRLVGDFGLFVEDGDPRLAELGFTFDRAQQGHGLASEAGTALLRFAFGTLGLHRIKAVVDCRNAPAIRLLERLGFRREGHFLQHAWFKGAWCDEYLYALLRSEWDSSRIVRGEPIEHLPIPEP
jgi:RimJ/RimL family protein N-acetyltransferase